MNTVNETSINKSLEHIKNLAYFDLDREKRIGVPEVVYAHSKTSEMVFKIAKNVLNKRPYLLISKLRPEHIHPLKIYEKDYEVEWGSYKQYCLIKKKEHIFNTNKGKIGIICAGTSDLPYAEEAKVMAKIMNCDTKMVTDVGVAGMHRLFQPLQELIRSEVRVLIVIAGMEGALPSVVAGLVDIPVIGLPTSTGYGYGGDGTCALMSMLQSCSLGIAVVNIDSGINAGAIAAKIAKTSTNSTLSYHYPDNQGHKQ